MTGNGLGFNLTYPPATNSVNATPFYFVDPDFTVTDLRVLARALAGTIRMREPRRLAHPRSCGGEARGVGLHRC
jgi:hypothetical protein